MTFSSRTNSYASYGQSFLPVDLSLKEQLVLVFGGSRAAYLELLKILDSGARVQLVAKVAVSEIQELLLTHAGRLTMTRLDPLEFIKDAPLPSLVLVFSLAAEVETALVEHYRKLSVPLFVQYRPALSDFSLPTYLKRGHLKVAVHTDGVLPCFEQILLDRLEESMQSDFDRMTIFISQLREKTDELLVGKEECRAPLMAALEGSEDFLMALSRSSFDEALRIYSERARLFLAQRNGGEALAESGSDGDDSHGG
ncbi:MAG: NAD(P)-dependent oxidoreductase [Candidatus Obscuribacter sp.]|nr:hypothetical protein [Candidatus Melainabacteria bacterium]MBL8081733.1 hypothetical protein [Candidatus Obscuribacter sp.]MDX1985244.1 NAD(P)-dependent oxidoreductase [Candidatus Obscuribacter sp.]